MAGKKCIPQRLRDALSESQSFEPVYQAQKAIAHIDPKRVAFLVTCPPACRLQTSSSPSPEPIS
eukprot:1268876-Pleurochrysis_carterae.AAC.1